MGQVKGRAATGNNACAFKCSLLTPACQIGLWCSYLYSSLGKKWAISTKRSPHRMTALSPQQKPPMFSGTFLLYHYLLERPKPRCRETPTYSLIWSASARALPLGVCLGHQLGSRFCGHWSHLYRIVVIAEAILDNGPFQSPPHTPRLICRLDDSPKRYIGRTRRAVLCR